MKRLAWHQMVWLTGRLCAERARSAAGGRATRAAGPLEREVRRRV